MTRVEKLKLPNWMGTSWGRWLARHWGPAAKLWRASMNAALLREAEEEQTAQRDRLLRDLSSWALDRGFGSLTEDDRFELIQSWCRWRNAAEHLHRQRERAAGAPLVLPVELTRGSKAEL